MLKIRGFLQKHDRKLFNTGETVQHAEPVHAVLVRLEIGIYMWKQIFQKKFNGLINMEKVGQFPIIFKVSMNGIIFLGVFCDRWLRNWHFYQLKGDLTSITRESQDVFYKEHLTWMLPGLCANQFLKQCACGGQCMTNVLKALKERTKWSNTQQFYKPVIQNWISANYRSILNKYSNISSKTQDFVGK